MKKLNKVIGIMAALLLSAAVTGCQGNRAADETVKETLTEMVTEAAETATAITETETSADIAAEAERRIFVDSAGREVEIPTEINTAAPSGQVAQMVLYTAVPEKLAAVAVDFTEDAKAYIDQKYTQLPVLGQFYGKNANLNMEELVKVNPDVVIDIGEKKDNIAADLDQLQEQINIPVIFVEATTETMDEAYAKLGELFDNEADMQVLGDYCKDVIDHAKEVSEGLTEEEKVSVYVAREEEGLGTDANGSFHAEALDLVGAVNIADVEAVGAGGGSIVSMEQILNWNPDVILVYTEEIYDTIVSSDLWADLDAVKSESVYLIPSGPYNFISNPPSVNRMIGISWLGNLLYPEQYTFDESVVTDFYDKFYHITPTEEQLASLK